MKRAVIFVNGNLSDIGRAKKFITKKDYLIAADGGVKHILKLGLIPDVVIGDLDSTPPTLIKKIKQMRKGLINQTSTLITYPTKKDKTDFELAINLVLEKKYQVIIIFGIFGDRIDHFLANIFLIAKIQMENQSTKIKIIEGKKEIFIVNKKIIIEGQVRDEISIIPVSEKLEGISTKGLQYELKGGKLIFGSTRGVSNVMNKNSATITLSKGLAIVEHNSQ